MPIDRLQFDLQVDRLIDAFGEKHFGDQRVHMIWESIKHLEYVDVISIVDEFIRTRSVGQAPKPVDFSEAAKDFASRKSALGQLRSRDVAKCWDCGDSGFVELERIDGYDDWAKWPRGHGPCHCERGQELVRVARIRAREKDRIEFGSAFDERWERSYRIVPLYARPLSVSENDDGPGAA